MKKIKKWYNGKTKTRRARGYCEQKGLIEGIINCTENYQEYHWTAQVARYAVKHHWKIIMAIIALLGLAAQLYIHNSQPKTPIPISYGDEGVRSDQPMPGNNGLRSNAAYSE